MEEVTQLAGQLTELSYALDTFYFLVCGALVMWMAAGFTMLESGLVRALQQHHAGRRRAVRAHGRETDRARVVGLSRLGLAKPLIEQDNRIL